MEENKIKFRPLLLFVFATNCLLLAGHIIGDDCNLIQLFLMQWCGLCGVFIVYGFNDLVDHSREVKLGVQSLLRNKFTFLFLLQFIFITIPLTLYFLSLTRIIILGSICVLGILYSINFKFLNNYYRIKNTFILKNAYIGTLWGSIIMAGANEFRNSYVLCLFMFTSLQVLIGSTIRDIPDIERDRMFGVNSFPVVLGIPKTLIVLHAINLISLFVCVLAEYESKLVILILVVIAWRLLTLINIQRKPNSKLWLQTMNVLTCGLIFLILLIEYLYEYYR